MVRVEGKTNSLSVHIWKSSFLKKHCKQCPVKEIRFIASEDSGSGNNPRTFRVGDPKGGEITINDLHKTMTMLLSKIETSINGKITIMNKTI